MVEEIKNYLEKLVKRTPGCRGICISSREGIPIFQASNDPQEDGELVRLQAQHLSLMSVVSDQASKMSLGRNKSMVAVFDNYQVVNFHSKSVMITVFGTKDAKTGSLLSLERDLDGVINHLTEVLELKN